MSIKFAQTFYLDKNLVKNSDSAVIDSVDLYFKSTPVSTKNRSGIDNPGVTVYVSPVQSNDVPNIEAIFGTGMARAEYVEIVASADASIPTKFSFSSPLVLSTDNSYAILIAFDGDEEFTLWECKEGEVLVGTNTTTAGASAKNVGKFYEYHVDDTDHWKALTNIDLKFTVSVCCYNSNSSATTTSDTYLMPCDSVEYIAFNRYHPNTINRTSLKIGEMVFQKTPVILGTIAVSNVSDTIVSSNNINFSTLFSEALVSSENVLSSNPIIDKNVYIVLRNGSNSTSNVDVVSVKSVISNTQLELERFPNFTNNTATFSITACGSLDYVDLYYHTGRWFDYIGKTFNRYVAKKADMVRLTNSNANSSVRFANNIVELITITSGGTGYSNSDVITVHPILDANTANSQNIAYIPEYANAIANVVTNGSGTITGISVTNAGWGMTSNVAYSISTSNGVSANLGITVGCTLRGAESNATLGDCFPVAMPIHRTYPNIRVVTNQHQDVSYRQHFPYYVYQNFEHIINQSNTAFNTEIHQFENTPIIDTFYNDGRVLVLSSFSQAQRMTSNVTVTFANGTSFATQVKVPSLLEISATSNNAFSMPILSHGQSYNYTYIINNDTTNEIKGHGNAMARHISEKVTFAENRNAEDVLVYCDVYRPIGTDINVYARIQNKSDQEAFDDKDWTKLILKSNNGSYVSSLTDETDIAEFTYGLATSPPSVNTITGYITCTTGQSNIVGIGTSLNTDLQVNDVVKIYSELFPTNYMISVVRSIANSTQITLDDAVSNTSLSASNCKLDLLGRPANGANSEIGSPFQAFSYVPNSYICRYYNSSMSKKDAYCTFQIKIVLTSNNSSIVPKVWNTRAVGVSA